MRLLVDINVPLGVALQGPGAPASPGLLATSGRRHEAWLARHSVATLSYLIERQRSPTRVATSFAACWTGQTWPETADPMHWRRWTCQCATARMHCQSRLPWPAARHSSSPATSANSGRPPRQRSAPRCSCSGIPIGPVRRGADAARGWWPPSEGRTGLRRVAGPVEEEKRDGRAPKLRLAVSRPVFAVRPTWGDLERHGASLDVWPEGSFCRQPY